MTRAQNAPSQSPLHAGDVSEDGRAIRLGSLLKFVLDHYANQDMNHVDFRVRAYELALECRTISVTEGMRARGAE